MYRDVIDELPHETRKSSEYKQLVKSLYEHITSQYNLSSFGMKEKIHENKKNIKYDIPTCVGSSGATINVIEVSGDQLNFTTSTHNSGGSSYNRSIKGRTFIFY